MKSSTFSQGHWLHTRLRRRRSRFHHGAVLPLHWLLCLPFCFLLGLGSGLLCGPGGLLSSFAMSKDRYQQEAFSQEQLSPAPAQEDGGLLLLSAPDDATPSPDAAPDASPEPSPETALPRVCIYCTHAGEEYQGQTRVNGQPGGVMSVAAALADALEAQGISVILDKTLHDSPSYDEAYGSSLDTVSRIQQENPSLEVLVDVHRDSAIPGLSTRLEVQGRSYARMMFIIGTNEKLEHPNWRQNQDFALSLTEALEAMCPGLTREPRVYSGRYNQHLSPNAILVEIGSTDNSQEEAERSAALLAAAICQVKGWETAGGSAGSPGL